MASIFSMTNEINFDFQGEDEGDGDDDNEDNDGFFVPHGYLSDDEGVGDGDDDECGENEENEVALLPDYISVENNTYNRVRTGHGKPGKSWNFTNSFLRSGTS